MSIFPDTVFPLICFQEPVCRKSCSGIFQLQSVISRANTYTHKYRYLSITATGGMTECLLPAPTIHTSHPSQSCGVAEVGTWLTKFVILVNV